MFHEMQVAGVGSVSPHIESGTVTGSGGDGQMVTANVTFEKPFDNPIILFRGKQTSDASYISTYAPYISAGIDTSLTTTGFTVKYGQHYTGSTRNFTVEWVAMEDSLVHS